MSEQTDDVEMLAYALDLIDKTPRSNTYRRQAELLLASDWLAAHDAEVAAAAEAAAGERIAHGIRFNIEVACDGYAHLMDEDVPGGVYDMTSYQQGAHDAAEGIRSVLPARVARLDAAAEQGGA